MTSFTVELRDLRRALAAVMPHVAAIKHQPAIARVRLTPQPQNLELTATDRYTVGMGLVSILDHVDPTGEVGVIDLLASDVAKLLAVHTVPAQDEETIIGIRVTDTSVTFTDVSGLFSGEALVLDRITPEETFPDLRAMFSGAVLAGYDITAGAWIDATRMHRFEAAQRAYGHPLIVEGTARGGSLIVRCGDSFLGLLALTRPDDDARVEANRWAEDWQRRLPSTPIPWEALTDVLYVSKPDTESP